MVRVSDFVLIFPRDFTKGFIAVFSGVGVPFFGKLFYVFYVGEDYDKPVLELDVEGSLPKTVVLRSTENEAKEEYERKEELENGCL